MTGDKAPNIEGRTCALESCGVPFAPKRSTQRYCCREHGQIANNAKRAYGVAPTTPPGETTDYKRQAKRDRKAITELTAERDDLRRELGLMSDLEAAALSPPVWLTPKRAAKGHRATACLLFADPHYSEVVKPDEVDGLNAYNDRIAEMRTRRAFAKTISMCRDYLAGVTYDGCVLMFPGDIVSGVIHEELEQTNSDSLFASVLFAVDLLIPGINMLAEDFGRVQIAAVVGNHGRRTRKPRFKGRARDNADWLVYMLLAREFKGDDRITLNIPNAMDAHVTVYDTTFLLTHGDQFRGGSGISGAVAPLLLGAHRKTRRETAAGRPYDIMAMGHWHSRMTLPGKGIIAGGSLIGLDEFGYGHNFEAEPPSAELWLCTPEHGVTVSAPIFVSDRKREGW